MKKIVMALLITVGIAGCGNSTNESTSASSTTTSRPITVSETDQVSALGVLLAALHLRDGDIEQALADASITVHEIDAAIQAIDDDALDEWASLLD